MRICNLEVKNYRTLENIEIDFSSYYTCICGKNDAGKSNLINVLCSVFSPDDIDIVFSRRSSEISLLSDYTKWKENSKTPRKIEIKVSIEIDKDNDAGVFEFITTYLNLDFNSQKLPI